MRKLKNEELNRLSAQEFKQSAKTPIVLVLDNVRSLNNIGSAFRTADAFLLESIYLCGITGTPPHRDIQKTALGATETVNWQYFKTTIEAIAQLKKDDFLIYGIEQADNTIKLDEYKPIKNKKTAFVFGNEVSGVDEEVLMQCNGIIEIPQLGTKHSLNISVSIGIVVWDVFVKLNKAF